MAVGKILLYGMAAFIGVVFIIGSIISSLKNNNASSSNINPVVHDSQNAKVDETPKLDEKEKAIKKKLEAELRKEAIKQRKEYAKTFEGNLLSVGMDATVRAQGKDATTIVITHVMVNRPFVYQFQRDQATLSTLQKYGFQRVVLSDGFGQSWDFLI